MIVGGSGMKARLNATMAAACPFTAASSTIS
jgi:hypothetical protein